ncbi:unnamed protein product [Cyprideis torosa]|uniref:Uncharacterized protein n=1 Tax=Cyprideis torosa TaxID=163714 RepID=A0A7R8ZNN0_9CRUS|nr:unnamed protein product [Cyprideis torosa]CAG0891990.1 unnamed protein product [Cyprideis torosa]
MGWKLWSRRPQVRIRAGDDQATDLLVGPASPDEFQRPTGLTSQEQMERDELVPILNPYSVVSPDIVQLSPSWEQRDLPGEHLNLENVLSDLDHDVDKSPPDRAAAPSLPVPAQRREVLHSVPNPT